MTTQLLSTSALNTLNANLVPTSLTGKINNQKQLRTAMKNNAVLRKQIVDLFTYFKRCADSRANGKTWGRFKVKYASVGSVTILTPRQGADLWYYYLRFQNKSLGQVYIAAHDVGLKTGLNSEVYLGREGYRL